jgi:hypothetical protein
MSISETIVPTSEAPPRGRASRLWLALAYLSIVAIPFAVIGSMLGLAALALLMLVGTIVAALGLPPTVSFRLVRRGDALSGHCRLLMRIWWLNLACLALMLGATNWLNFNTTSAARPPPPGVIIRQDS